MATLSPYHLTFWVFAGSFGYVLGQGHGLALGVCIATGLSGVISLLFK